MKTEFFIDYHLYDTTALSDASELASNNASFANIKMIKENVSAPNYMTLEKNFSVLDGSFEELPEEPDKLVYFSSEQSGEDGKFSEKHSISVQFSEKHTSIGITLHFLSDYPLEVDIYWYDLSGVLKSSKKFYPDSVDYFCKNQIEEYGGLEIVFVKTLPFHNVKLQYIEYGTKITWGNDIVKAGKLINDTDPISDKIKTDKLTFDFVDSNEDFNVGNIDGLHKTFQKKQRMIPYEIIDGKMLPLGIFFLDSNSTTKNISKISAIDYKGMLANTDFRDGKIYNGETAGTIIDEIMAAAGIEDYEVDEETSSTPLYGTLKIQTCQKALREVLFACGSIINTSRRAGIEIRKSNRIISTLIPRSKKFSTTLQTDNYVSDVNVKYTTWTLDDAVSEITKGVYNQGIHTIQMTNPAANLTSNVGTIIKQMPYYIVLQIDEENTSEVIISGQKYVSEEFAALASIEYIKSGEVRNTKTFSGTLLDFAAAQRSAENILDYYQLQQIIQTRHIGAEEKAGDWAEIENTLSEHSNFAACIESLSTDLTGGFISTAKYRGYYKVLSEYYYCDSELYAGEEIGII